MRKRPTALLVACCVAVLTGCSSTPKLTTTPTTDVDLSGRWEIDRVRSDDPRQALRSVMTVAAAENGNSDGEDRGATGGTPDEPRDKTRRRRGGSGGGPRGGEPRSKAPRDGESGGRNDGQLAAGMFLQDSDWLVIEQTSERLKVNYGDQRSRSFPIGSPQTSFGLAGKLETESGWEGSEFVAVSAGESQLVVVERFVLSEDGRHLVLVTEIDAKTLDDPITIRRVFNAPTS